MDKVIKYIDENKKRFVDEMIEFLKIKSVSADSKLNEETKRCAEGFAEHLRKIGVKGAKTINTSGHPVVYGEMINDRNKPTFLIYGHYDVMPAHKSDGWDTEPFEPVIKDNYIYGRGTADDKGKLMCSINAIEAYIKTNTPLPVNFKFLIEGDEEAGGDCVHKFIRENKDLLACDAVVLFDTPWLLPNYPSITYSLRGICYWQVDLKGPNRDLHSGIYGGQPRNPLNVAAYMISKLHSEDGKVLIPGFYDDVVPLKEEERKEFAALPFKEDNVMKDIGVDALWGEKGYTALERNWGRPALDANGIWGGYQGEGSKTVIPSEAHFKVSTRLVAEQDPKKIDEAFKKYIEKLCPKGITFKISTFNTVSPTMTPIDNRFIKSVSQAIESAFGKKPALIRNGASIPVTATFKDTLKVPSLMFDLNNPDEAIHGPNEKFGLDVFHKGTKAAAYFFELAGK
jgi:acetylornithine deacetylase/succinyl-diaminopimelate desuccinylase-like protein